MLQTLGDPRWQCNLSTALVLEYEVVMIREATRLCLAIVDRICAVGREGRVFFRWRNLLPDPNDDFLLELGVSCRADFIVTYNLRDLAPAADFGIAVVTPGRFLRTIREEAQ